MAVSETIRRAVQAMFKNADQEDVLMGLESIPEPSAEAVRPRAELLQAAVIALAYGDRAIFDGQLTNAIADPRDVIYVLQSPELVDPKLTRGELIERYRNHGLTIPDVLKT